MVTKMTAKTINIIERSGMVEDRDGRLKSLYPEPH